VKLSLRDIPADVAARYVEQGWWDDRSLGDVVHAGLRDAHDRPFAVHSQVRPFRGDIGDVGRSARSFASWLGGRGIGPGDVVVMQLPNWAEAGTTFWGAAYAGAVVVPVVHFYGAKELGYILRATPPSLLVTADRFGSRNYVESLADLVTELDIPWAVVRTSDAPLPDGAISFDATLDEPPVERPVAVDPDDPAIIAFTSGTTRDPKGVVHSHRTIGFEGRQAATMTPVGGPPPITAAPVGHFIGMLTSLVGSLVRAAPINLLDAWNATRVLDLMIDEGLALTGGAPYFFTSLLEHPDFTADHLARMPFAGLGGTSVPLAFTRRLTDLGIDVMRCYGSTEHPTITGCTFDEDVLKRITTDGHPLAGVEVRVDAEGQIFSRGPDLFLGYTDPDLTASVFDDDGWYRTGDVGELDDDGFLTITDRISDVIIRGGENISALEVEEELLGLDDVVEVAVVAAPDVRMGERAVAVVRVRDGHRVPTPDDVRAHLAASDLAKQKWPESILAVDEFPRTPSGKIQKYKLRAMLRDDRSGDPPG
jgi:acyl-CoA synthetase